MTITQRRQGRFRLLGRAEAGELSNDWFDPGAWPSATPTPGGRGGGWFLSDADRHWVLRHYHRGGFIGRVISDVYLPPIRHDYRPFAEWHLTNQLHEGGLPVPRPIAARVEHLGLCYRADLITERIEHARSLAEVLEGAVDEGVWEAVGSMLRRFHRVGLDHADLNAHNILLTAQQPYLIDFDRSRLRAPGSWTGPNLDRLKRSLDKVTPEAQHEAMEQGWRRLCRAYRRQR